MQIDVVNRARITTLKGNKETGVISIFSSNDTAPKISREFKSCIKLQFDDIDDMREGLILFNESMANKLLNYVDKCVLLGVYKLIIHCDAGLSRSPGVAVALNEIYNGIKIVPPCWQHYNRRVYKIIIDTYHGNLTKRVTS